MEIMKWNRSSSGHFSETLAYLSLGPGFPLSLNDGWCAQWWTTFQKVSKVLSDIQRGTNKTHTRCNSSSSPIHDHKHNLTTSWYTITSGSTNTFIRAPMLTTTQIWKKGQRISSASQASTFVQAFLIKFLLENLISIFTLKRKRATRFVDNNYYNYWVKIS